VEVAAPWPVLVRYDLIEWRSDTLWRYPDVYRRGGGTFARALEVLAANSVDTTTVDRRGLRMWLARRISAPAAFIVATASRPTSA
jgi:hypothetical protein